MYINTNDYTYICLCDTNPSDLGLNVKEDCDMFIATNPMMALSRHEYSTHLL